MKVIVEYVGVMGFAKVLGNFIDQLDLVEPVFLTVVQGEDRVIVSTLDTKKTIIYRAYSYPCWTWAVEELTFKEYASMIDGIPYMNRDPVCKHIVDFHFDPNYTMKANLPSVAKHFIDFFEMRVK